VELTIAAVVVVVVVVVVLVVPVGGKVLMMDVDGGLECVTVVALQLVPF